MPGPLSPSTGYPIIRGNVEKGLVPDSSVLVISEIWSRAIAQTGRLVRP